MTDIVFLFFNNQYTKIKITKGSTITKKIKINFKNKEVDEDNKAMASNAILINPSIQKY